MENGVREVEYLNVRETVCLSVCPCVTFFQAREVPKGKLRQVEQENMTEWESERESV